MEIGAKLLSDFVLSKNPRAILHFPYYLLFFLKMLLHLLYYLLSLFELDFARIITNDETIQCSALVTP